MSVKIKILTPLFLSFFFFFKRKLLRKLNNLYKCTKNYFLLLSVSNENIFFCCINKQNEYDNLLKEKLK